MCVCVCLFIYIYVCVCVYIYTYTHTHTHTQIYLSISHIHTQSLRADLARPVSSQLRHDFMHCGLIRDDTVSSGGFLPTF